MNVLDQARKDMREHRQLRFGQAVFNAAYRKNPLVQQLAGTKVDPFYDDTKVYKFLARIRELFGVK
jgi:hypothetical protein